MNRVLLSFLVSAMAFSFSAPSQAARKSIDAYWKDVGLKFNFVEGELSSENCYSDERTFLGCVYAVNSVLGFQQPAVSLVVGSRLQSETGFGQPVETFGSAVIIAPKKFQSESPIELYENAKKERATTNASWSALYKSRGGSQPVVFEDVLAYAKRSAAFAEKEYLISAAALNAFLGVVEDPHTMYLPAQYVKDQSKGTSDDFTGIGITIRTLNQGGRKVVVIQSPIEGGPALKAGLHANDVLLAVDGQNVEGLSQDELSGRIQGPEGKPVQITVQRKGQHLNFTVVRAKISMPNVSSKMVGDVGYVKFASFIKDKGCEDLQSAVASLEKQGAKALIFDLRENGGGLLVQAVCVANIFLDKGKQVVSTQSTSAFGGNRELVTTEPRQTSLPLITLINAHSASASELVAGALQDHGRSFLVGERSFGKGTVQTQLPAAGGRLVLRQTIARFFLPSGRTNQIEGVHPDVEVFKKPNPTAEDKFAMREEDEYMAFPPTGPKWQQPRAQVVAQLTTCVEQEGTAKTQFAQSTESALPPDFQLLSAVDAAHCVVAHHLGDEEIQVARRATPVAFGEAPSRDLFREIRERVTRALIQ